MEKKDIKKIDTDVAVIGSGAGGMITALRAKECGVERVMLLEKRDVLGGCCTCFGMTLAINTPMHKRCGLHIDMHKVFMEHMKVQNWNCDAKLVSRWFNITGELFEWLEDMGVAVTEVLESGDFGDNTMRMQHVSSKLGINIGNQIMTNLVRRLEEAGVEISLKTRAKKLIIDDKGCVVGLQANKGDEIIEVNAKRVVIATGCISNNQDLINELIEPSRTKGSTRNEAALPHNTGDGFIMAREAGAIKGKFSVMYFGPHQHPNSSAVCMLLRRPQVFTVNKFGERFLNESIVAAGGGYQWMSGNALQNQKDKIQYTMVDHASLREQIDNPKFESVIEYTLALVDFESDEYVNRNLDEIEPIGGVSARQKWLEVLEGELHKEAEKGHVLIANTLDEIAEWIGADPEVFKKEVAKYNQFCEYGYDAEFAKRSEYLKPFATPPYYVIEAWQGIDSIIGGIQVNHKLQVLNENEDPIQGLYAVGIGNSGFLGGGYSYPGTESSYTMSSGYIAGAEIANDIMGN